VTELEIGRLAGLEALVVAMAETQATG